MSYKIDMVNINNILDFKNPPIKQWMALIGILLIIIGVFLPWLSFDYSQYEPYTGTTIDTSNSDDGLSFGKGIITLFFGILMILGILFNIYKDGKLLKVVDIINIDMPFNKKQVTRVISLFLGILVFLLIIFSLRDVYRLADDLTFEFPLGNGGHQKSDASPGIGIWFCFIGSIIAEIGLFQWIQEEEEFLESYENETEYNEDEEIEKPLKGIKQKNKRKSKNQVIESFVNIQGIGPSKGENLYNSGFKSIDDLRNASINEISKVKGFTNISAKRLKDNID